MKTQIIANNNSISLIFKKILIKSHIHYKKIYLSGSSINGHLDSESDWAFLVVLKNKIFSKEKQVLITFLKSAFHKYFLTTPIDIIIKDQGSFEREKKVTNTLSNKIYLEGMEI